MTDRYVDPVIQAITSPERELVRRVDVLLAAAGVISDHSAGFSINWNTLGRRQAEIEAETGHDLASLVQALREQCPPDLARWIHFGLTSSDVVDTSQSLMLELIDDHLDSEIDKVAAALNARAHEWAEFPMAMRTHGRLAGMDGAGRMVSILRGYFTRIRETPTPKAYGRLRGPLGDNAIFTFANERDALADLGISGLGSPLAQTLPRDLLFERVHRWARIANACEQVALWVRLHATWDEIREPTGVSAYKGSSVLAHKRNPTRSERVCGLAAVVRSDAATIGQFVTTWDGRDLAHSSVERVTIARAANLTGFLLAEIKDIVRGMELNTRQATLNAASVGRPDVDLARLVQSGVDPEEAYREIQSQGRG